MRDGKGVKGADARRVGSWNIGPRDIDVEVHRALEDSKKFEGKLS